jgi:hypothetical protein
MEVSSVVKAITDCRRNGCHAPIQMIPPHYKGPSREVVNAGSYPCTEAVVSLVSGAISTFPRCNFQVRRFG